MNPTFAQEPWDKTMNQDKTPVPAPEEKQDARPDGHTDKPRSNEPKTEQDAPNYQPTSDQGQALPGDALSSANDE